MGTLSIIATVCNFSGESNYDYNMQLFFISVDTACISLEMLLLVLLANLWFNLFSLCFVTYIIHSITLIICELYDIHSTSHRCFFFSLNILAHLNTYTCPQVFHWSRVQCSSLNTLVLSEQKKC